MKFEVRIGGVSRVVESERDVAGVPQFRIDGRTVAADAVEVGVNGYSILLNGQSFEVHMQAAPDGLLVRCVGEEFSVQVRDPRAWRGAQGAQLAAEGRVQVTAPMPGKVVRVLVAAGDTVEAGQGLAVVEAMKMQNEIRAPKGGTVERVFVKENQAVVGGEPLATIS